VVDRRHAIHAFQYSGEGAKIDPDEGLSFTPSSSFTAPGSILTPASDFIFFTSQYNWTRPRGGDMASGLTTPASIFTIRKALPGMARHGGANAVEC
jgi:hypothetical protein